MPVEAVAGLVGFAILFLIWVVLPSRLVRRPADEDE